MICECYHDDINFIGERGVCWGAKEKEPCRCGGDESKCDFYPKRAAIVLDKNKAFEFKLDGEASQIQVIKDMKKYGLAVLRPKTNADRIRAMTDEELAEWFIRIQYDVSDYYCGGHSCEPTLPTGEESWLGWLKQEADA